MFELTYDAAARTLLARNSGFWTAQIAQEYLRAVVLEAARARAAAGRLRLLVDGRDANVLSAEAVSILAGFEAGVIASPDDRVAILIASSLAKMQTRRSLSSRQIEIFMSESAARTWLNAYD